MKRGKRRKLKLSEILQSFDKPMGIVISNEIRQAIHKGEEPEAKIVIRGARGSLNIGRVNLQEIFERVTGKPKSRKYILSRNTEPSGERIIFLKVHKKGEVDSELPMASSIKSISPIDMRITSCGPKGPGGGRPK